MCWNDLIKKIVGVMPILGMLAPLGTTFLRKSNTPVFEIVDAMSHF